jgi:hypothetical protein
MQKSTPSVIDRRQAGAAAPPRWRATPWVNRRRAPGDSQKAQERRSERAPDFEVPSLRCALTSPIAMRMAEERPAIERSAIERSAIEERSAVEERCGIRWCRIVVGRWTRVGFRVIGLRLRIILLLHIGLRLRLHRQLSLRLRLHRHVSRRSCD